MLLAPVSNSHAHPLDEFGRNVVDAGAAPFTMARDGVKEFAKAMTPGEYVHHEFDNETPPISKLAYRVLEFYLNFHSNVLRNSLNYAEQVERLVEKVVKWPLTPLTYFETGTAIQKFICETIIGTTVFVIIYVALQVFHIIPYITSGVVLTGTYLFYQTAPVAMITLIAASILLLNVYFLWYVAGEVRAGNNTLKEGFKEAQATLLEAKKTLTEGINVIKKGVDSIEGDVKNLVIPTILWAGAVVIVAHYSPTHISNYLHGAAAAGIGLNYVIPAVKNIWQSRFAVRK